MINPIIVLLPRLTVRMISVIRYPWANSFSQLHTKCSLQYSAPSYSDANPFPGYWNKYLHSYRHAHASGRAEGNKRKGAARDNELKIGPAVYIFLLRKVIPSCRPCWWSIREYFCRWFFIIDEWKGVSRRLMCGCTWRRSFSDHSSTPDWRITKVRHNSSTRERGGNN